MSILISLALLLTSRWICHGFAPEDTYIYKSNNPIRIGNNDTRIPKKKSDYDQEGRMIGNPNDPNYQQMAKDFVHSQLRIKEEDTINITLYKVVTKADSGQITRLQLRVFLVDSKSIGCRAKIWKQPWQDVEHISFCCENNKISSVSNGDPSPDNPKYRELVRVTLKAWFTINGQKPFKEEDIKAIRVTSVKTQITSEVINLVNFNVVTLSNDKFHCISRIMDIPWDPEDTMPFPEIKCNVDGDESESREWTEIAIIEEVAKAREIRDHNDIKYKQLATESAINYFEITGNKLYKIDDIKMMSVIGITTRVRKAEIIYINFDIIAFNTGTKTGIFNCSSVYEKLEYTMKSFSLQCLEYSHQQKASYSWKNPSEVKFALAAKKSLIKYLEKSGDHLGVTDILVTFVIKRLAEESIFDINFIVQLSQSHTLECYSSVWDRNSLEVKAVNCKHVNGGLPSSEMQQSPNEPKYKYLAEESFEKYKNSHDLLIEVNELKVTQVITQVVAEEITRIDFLVIPPDGRSFPCHSEIREQQSLQKRNISVTCDYDMHQQPGGLVQQNPDEPKYKYLAKEAFEKYLKSNISRLIEVRALKVTRVTTQRFSGEITRIDFFVILIKGETFSCHSEIWEHRVSQKRDIAVTCDHDKHQQPDDKGQQDPEDPKYKYLAEEAFEKYRKSHMNLTIEVREIKVTVRLMTQVVSGKRTRLNFFVIPIKGNTISCLSEIWEHQAFQQKDISVICDYDKHQQSAGQVQQNPGDLKYKYLAEESFERYRQSHIGLLIDGRELQITRVTTQEVAGIITKIEFSVIPTADESFPCYSEIREHQLLLSKDITVICDYNKYKPESGGLMQENSDDPKYKYLAKESFEKYRKSHKGILFEVDDVRVTRVTAELFSGVITRIDFNVFLIKGETLSCHSGIWEHQSLQNKDITVTCNHYEPQKPGGQVQQNPDDPKYKYLAEEAFQKYLESQIGLLIKVREFKVIQVTTQVIPGEVTRIVFFVILTDGQSFPCHSEIREQQSLQKKDITVACDYDKHQQAGIQVLQNSDEPKYKYLAEEAFEKYQKSHVGFLFEVRELRVTRVTTQVISGVITRIDFNVIPIMGEFLSCHSEIWEHQPIQKKDISVTCDYDKHRQPDGQVQQNPDDPKYRHLAEESFEKYRNSHFGIVIDVKEFRVTKVITQKVLGVITRVDFNVIPIEGKAFACHSEIWEVQTLKKKDIAVTCDYHTYQILTDGQLQQNPDDPKYKPLAVESFEKYLKLHTGLLIDVRDLKITRVTTTQVVSGMIIRIDFNVIPIKGDSFSCHSEIWHQQSLQKSIINVTCDYYEYKILSDDQVQQNPDNLVYKQLAEESFQKYIKHHADFRIQVNGLKVIRVTTQLHGKLIRIDFHVYTNKGRMIPCHSEIQKPLQKSDFTVQCQLNENDDLLDQEEQDLQDPKYKDLIQHSFDKYRLQIGLPIKVSELKIIGVVRQVTSGVITTKIDFNVIPVEGISFPCRSEIREQQLLHDQEIIVTCSHEKYQLIPDSQVKLSPDNIEYKRLAEESFEEYMKSNTNIRIKVKDLKVARVTTQVVSGTLIRIDFHVYPTKGHIIPCHSEIWIHNHKKNITVHCQLNQHLKPNPQEVQNPNDPRYKHYKQLTEESFETYRLQTGLYIKVHELIVIKVTREAGPGVVTTRIDFNVILADEGGTFPCHSEIREQQLLHKQEIIVTCSHEKYKLLPGGHVQQDPDNPEYKSLAEESFKRFLKSIGIRIQITGLKVNKVTTQTVSGTVIRIDFQVYPAKGRTIPCQSEIRKQLQRSDFNVQCKLHEHDGGQEEQNPNDPKYKYLAEESFEVYQSRNGLSLDVEELKVTRVTTEVDSGVIIQIDFNVIPIAGKSFPCHSEIRDKHLPQNKEITVKCESPKNNHLTLTLSQHDKPDGKREQDPNDPKYKRLAEESFEVFLKSNSGAQIRVQKLKVTRVTTQIVSVSRIKTSIDFKVTSTENTLFTCHSEVQEYKSLQKKDRQFTVECAEQKCAVC